MLTGARFWWVIAPATLGFVIMFTSITLAESNLALKSRIDQRERSVRQSRLLERLRVELMAAPARPASAAAPAP